MLTIIFFIIFYLIVIIFLILFFIFKNKNKDIFMNFFATFLIITLIPTAFLGYKVSSINIENKKEESFKYKYDIENVNISNFFDKIFDTNTISSFLETNKNNLYFNDYIMSFYFDINGNSYFNKYPFYEHYQFKKDWESNFVYKKDNNFYYYSTFIENDNVNIRTYNEIYNGSRLKLIQLDLIKDMLSYINFKYILNDANEKIEVSGTNELFSVNVSFIENSNKDYEGSIDKKDIIYLINISVSKMYLNEENFPLVSDSIKYSYNFIKTN